MINENQKDLLKLTYTLIKESQSELDRIQMESAIQNFGVDNKNKEALSFLSELLENIFKIIPYSEAYKIVLSKFNKVYENFDKLQPCSSNN